MSFKPTETLYVRIPVDHYIFMNVNGMSLLPLSYPLRQSFCLRRS